MSFAIKSISYHSSDCIHLFKCKSSSKSKNLLRKVIFSHMKQPRKIKARKFTSMLLQYEGTYQLIICKSTSLQMVFDLIKLKIQKDCQFPIFFNTITCIMHHMRFSNCLPCLFLQIIKMQEMNVSNLRLHDFSA